MKLISIDIISNILSATTTDTFLKTVQLQVLDNWP